MAMFISTIGIGQHLSEVSSVLVTFRSFMSMHIPVSAGSVFNFNKEAYEGLASF